jgi:DNA-binding MarR family transcriptional regulator
VKTVQEQLGLPKPIATHQHEVVMAIMLTARMLSGMGRDLLKESGLTEAQFNILMLLQYQFPEGTMQVELSKRMLVNRANVTGLVDRLVRDGLVSRTQKADNRRANNICITPGGSAALAKAAPSYFEGVNKLSGGVTEAQQDQLIATLLSICSLIEKEQNGAAG